MSKFKTHEDLSDYLLGQCGLAMLKGGNLVPLAEQPYPIEAFAQAAGNVLGVTLNSYDVRRAPKFDKLREDFEQIVPGGGEVFKNMRDQMVRDTAMIIRLRSKWNKRGAGLS